MSLRSAHNSPGFSFARPHILPSRIARIMADDMACASEVDDRPNLFSSLRYAPSARNGPSPDTGARKSGNLDRELSLDILALIAGASAALILLLVAVQ